MQEFRVDVRRQIDATLGELRRFLAHRCIGIYQRLVRTDGGHAKIVGLQRLPNLDALFARDRYRCGC